MFESHEEGVQFKLCMKCHVTLKGLMDNRNNCSSLVEKGYDQNVTLNATLHEMGWMDN